MTDYVLEESRVLRENYTTLYDLLPGDTLTIRSEPWTLPTPPWDPPTEFIIDVKARFSTIAVLGSDTALTLDGPVWASAYGTAFAGTGDRVSVNVGSLAYIHSVKGYALDLEGSENTIVIDGNILSGDTFDPSITGFGGISSGGMSHLTVTGGITANKMAVFFSGGGNDIHNAAGGFISGGMGAFRIMGGDNTITNEGTVTSQSGAAIYLTSGGGSTNLITNRGGDIEAEYEGYAIQVTGLSHDRIVNVSHVEDGSVRDGLIVGAIDLGLGNDTIENAATIVGTMDLGTGHDTVINTGQIIGDVRLGTGNDLFDGASGDHEDGTIFGGEGNDVVAGGRMDETISGGLGSDHLTGNDGQDTFWFDAALGGSNVDSILDFNIGEDRFWLSSDIFGLGVGQLTADAFCMGAVATDATDRIVYNAAAGTLALDRDGTGDAYAAIVFARIHPGTALGADHFLVV